MAKYAIGLPAVRSALTRAGIKSWDIASTGTVPADDNQILLEKRGQYIYFNGAGATMAERDENERLAYKALKAAFGPDAVYFQYPFMYVSGVNA